MYAIFFSRVLLYTFIYFGMLCRQHNSFCSCSNRWAHFDMHTECVNMSNVRSAACTHVCMRIKVCLDDSDNNQKKSADTTFQNKCSSVSTILTRTNPRENTALHTTYSTCLYPSTLTTSSAISQCSSNPSILAHASQTSPQISHLQFKNSQFPPQSGSDGGNGQIVSACSFW